VGDATNNIPFIAAGIVLTGMGIGKAYPNFYGEIGGICLSFIGLWLGLKGNRELPRGPFK
jgi:hypothetical protein